jgi:hypothetical protein
MAMFLVKIDLAMLGARLSLSKHETMSNGDVMAWLVQMGFHICRQGYVVSAERLAMLQIREIVVSYPIDDAPFIS